MTQVPDFVYKLIEDRTDEELLATLELQKAGIKKHTQLAKWGNTESKERLRAIRFAKKKVEAEIKRRQAL